MNKHHREHESHRESKMIKSSTKCDYDSADTHGLDAIMSGKKASPDTDTSHHEKGMMDGKGNGGTSVGIKYTQHHDKEKPFTDTTHHMKNGGECHKSKRMHMAAGGVGKIRHEQYY